MGCGDFIAKYLLFCVNFVVTLISLTIIGLGAFLLYISKATESNVPELLYIPIIIIVGGCLLFIIASFGCCGTIAEKSCLLILYIICMVILCGGSIYLSILFKGDMKSAEVALETELESKFDNADTRALFLVVEGLLKCCGTTGPEAYLQRNLTIPVTCCPNPTLGNVTIDDVDDINNIQFCEKEESYSGCTAILTDLIDLFTSVVYYFLVAIIIVQVVGILSSLYLAYEFRVNAKLKKAMSYSRY